MYITESGGTNRESMFLLFRSVWRGASRETTRRLRMGWSVLNNAAINQLSRGPVKFESAAIILTSLSDVLLSILARKFRSSQAHCSARTSAGGLL